MSAVGNNPNAVNPTTFNPLALVTYTEASEQNWQTFWAVANIVGLVFIATIGTAAALVLIWVEIPAFVVVTIVVGKMAWTNWRDFSSGKIEEHVKSAQIASEIAGTNVSLAPYLRNLQGQINYDQKRIDEINKELKDLGDSDRDILAIDVDQLTTFEKKELKPLKKQLYDLRQAQNPNQQAIRKLEGDIRTKTVIHTWKLQQKLGLCRVYKAVYSHLYDNPTDLRAMGSLYSAHVQEWAEFCQNEIIAARTNTKNPLVTIGATELSLADFFPVDDNYLKNLFKQQN